MSDSTHDDFRGCRLGDSPGDDDESWLELGEIRMLEPSDDLDGDQSFALGSNIHLLATRVATPSDVDQELIAYLLDIEPPR